MATTTVENGVDVQALLGTIDAPNATPELTCSTFRAAPARGGGTHSSTPIGSSVHAREVLA